MSIIKEFREFALKGNVLDLAVGVVIGAAFGKIVSSIVEDFINPIVGLIIGGIDFSNLYLPLSSGIPAGASLADAKKAGAVIAYGNFISVIIQFTIVALCIFLVVRVINFARARFEEQKTSPEPPPLSAQEKLLTEIRDLLKSR